MYYPKPSVYNRTTLLETYPTEWLRNIQTGECNGRNNDFLYKYNQKHVLCNSKNLYKRAKTGHMLRALRIQLIPRNLEFEKIHEFLIQCLARLSDDRREKKLSLRGKFPSLVVFLIDNFLKISQKS